MIEQKGFTVSATVLDVTAVAVTSYHGFTVRETAGAAATVTIREGSSSGDILDTVGLAANESSSDLYPIGSGVRCDGDLVVVVTGTVVGSLRYA